MRTVQEQPLLPQAVPENLNGLAIAYGILLRLLREVFREIGYRLNRTLPKDGSEAMTSQLPLSDPTFDDYIVPGLQLRLGASAPGLENLRNGIYGMAFAGTGAVVEQGFFTVHILHGIRPGTTPTFHIHWAHNQAAPSGNVKWQIEYTIAKGYGAGTLAASTTLSTVQAAPAQYVHEITDDDDMPLASITEIEPDTVILARVFRDPADGADTFEADAFLLQVDMHYERGVIGTPERNRPFAGF